MALTRPPQSLFYNNDAQTITAAGTTTTLTASSPRISIVTGSNSHGFKLPDASTCYVGQTFKFLNMTSNWSLYLYTADNVLWDYGVWQNSIEVICVTASGTTKASWAYKILQAGNNFKVGAINLAGGRLFFPATANPISNSTVLDDYEEGTWTPVIVGLTTGGTGTYTTNVGTYVKVGERVSYSGHIVMTNHTGTGSMQINGLPFTCDSTSPTGIIGYHNNLTLSANSYPGLRVTSAGATISLNQYAPSAGSFLITMDTAFEIIFSGEYTI